MPQDDVEFNAVVAGATVGAVLGGGSTGGTDSAVTGYRIAFRSASIMGGASAVSMAIGLARAKVFAVLLGPAGTGLMGLFGQVINLTGTISNFGISSSGVRQIAEAAGSGDATRIAQADRTVRRMAWITGSLGLAAQLALCWLLSLWTFGDTDHWKSIAWLSVIPLLQALAGARVARIQGLRHIGDLARQNVLAALIGTATAVLLVWSLGFDGIVPQMIVVAAVTLLLSSVYSRKISLASLHVSWRDSLRMARSLVGLGFSLMAGSLAGVAATYVISVLIARQLGVQANGLYIAAWSLSGLYANFVLNAMGADYYPRLSAVAHDPARLLPIVNQQADIALLVATPGIVGTLAFAPIAIQVFYSGAYAAAYPVMRWLVLAVFLKLVSWPLSYVMLAKGAAKLYLATETLHQCLNVALVYALLGRFGLPGAGIAASVLYVVYSLVVLGIVWRLYGFRYSRHYPALLAACLALTLGAFALPAVGTVWVRYSAGAGLAASAAVLCGLVLKRVMGLGTAHEIFSILIRLTGMRKKDS